MDEGLLLRMLKGIATRNYEACAETVPEAFGLSRSSVSRRYVKGTARKLAERAYKSLTGTPDAIGIPYAHQGVEGLRALAAAGIASVLPTSPASLGYVIAISSARNRSNSLPAKENDHAASGSAFGAAFFAGDRVQVPVPEEPVEQEPVPCSTVVNFWDVVSQRLTAVMLQG